MNILFVLNPISGGIEKDSLKQLIATTCSDKGISFHMYETTGESDKDAIIGLLNKLEPSRCVAIGGDGTLLLVATCLLNKNIPLALIPAGSANGMARELSLDHSQEDALELALSEQHTKGLDILCVNDSHYSIHIGDMGINAQMVKGFAEEGERGMLSYAKHFFNALVETKPFRAVVTTEEGTHSASFVMIAMCNARYYGTGIPLNNLSEPTDGLFELVLFEDITMPNLLSFPVGDVLETIKEMKTKRVLQTKQATITLDTPQILQLDGEILGEVDEVRVALMAEAVQLIVPK